MSVDVRWFPERLNVAIAAAYQQSLKTALGDAVTHVPTAKAGVVLRGDTLAATGIGAVFEKGRSGGYDIAPRDKLALKFPDGGFATFARGGPMRPRPYLAPAAGRWANGGFQAVARSVLGAQGF